MGEVQWIKLYIDMFDRRKINKIRRLPAGNDILLFWVMLLATAGKCNAGGMIYITERVPFTKEDLADEFDFEISTIELALKAFVEFDMIDLYEDGFISVKNWEYYQNSDKLAEIRAKDRERKRLKKAQAKGELPVSTEIPRKFHGNSTDVPHIEEDKDKEDKEEDKERKKEKELITITTTTSRTRETEGVENSLVENAPLLLEVAEYFDTTDPRFDKNGNKYLEANKFIAYNAMRGWDCLPDWQKAADLWLARMDDKKG